MVAGKVYFVSAPGRIKIGYTRHPERRLSGLQTTDMEQLTILGVVPGTRAFEKMLHVRAEPHRLRGEWFADCEAVRAIVSDALSGKYKVDEDTTETSQAQDVASPLGDIVQSSMRKLAELANEIDKRARARQGVSDLVDFALFLSEHVLAPAFLITAGGRGNEHLDDDAREDAAATIPKRPEARA